MQEQFLALMPFIQKRDAGFDKLLSGGSSDKDNVDIGALCTIDKGVTGDTTIGEGTKSIIRCM
jgi:UDP-3-O-[3-hydroxymyristoyl] glucosamine N-acyltransferase